MYENSQVRSYVLYTGQTARNLINHKEYLTYDICFPEDNKLETTTPRINK